LRPLPKHETIIINLVFLANTGVIELWRGIAMVTSIKRYVPVLSIILLGFAILMAPPAGVGRVARVDRKLLVR